MGEMSEIINSLRPAAKLSKLQKRILEEALRAFWWHAPIHRAWAGTLEPGSFDSAPILINFYSLTKAEIRRPSRWRKEVRKPGGKLPRARVAICRAIRSLIGRGLLEQTHHRGLWRLTVLGKKVAPGLCPDITRPAMRELVPKIKEAYVTRKNMRRLEPGTDLKSFIRNCFRPGVKTPLDSPIAKDLAFLRQCDQMGPARRQ